jgi:Fe-S cluster assembly protein SufD
VLEVVVKENAFVEYYKIQHDGLNASQVGSTHIHQIGRSYVHTVVVSLNGGVIRNNLNLILDAAGNETHLYGLYLLKGKSHVDNHTLVDNKQPNCFSNQLYKGIAGDASTGVFSGRIIVQPDAQKTNAYQSNKKTSSYLIRRRSILNRSWRFLQTMSNVHTDVPLVNWMKKPCFI